MAVRSKAARKQAHRPVSEAGKDPTWMMRIKGLEDFRVIVSHGHGSRRTRYQYLSVRRYGSVKGQ